MKTRRIILANVILLLMVLLVSPSGSTVSPGFVEFDELISDPKHYDGKYICTEGVYVRAFESNALGASTYKVGLSVRLSKPSIWISGYDSIQKTDCFGSETNPTAEFCQARIRGVFQ